MFEEKDYLMKMVKEFTAAISKLAGLKAEKNTEESQEVLNDTLKYFTDLDIKVIEALPYDILIHKISGNTINSEKHLMLSELLIQQADIYELKGETLRAKNLYIKSLNMMLNVLMEQKDPISESNNKVDELLEKIGWHNLPKESKLLLFQYYELIQNYGKAEDVLFNLLKTDEQNDAVLRQGMAFYKRLSQKDPVELQKGNLPMDEVFEGLETLKQYKK
ncbi:hypothetical protein DEAC_c38300 [Desulfosporosinus acididurans]|uniref:Tetratricopeptide repeat protein n=1 Tax=Desulfosporosinus acididurans TaxID=476652 RepID=A0A0J1FLG2_9FIRM|nr:DUF6483 family protein [Desulfosporosinus acididurans]KLU64197.1 hypothetical protein DEAC_c38300 [Desulfosporosinus acididurans]